MKDLALILRFVLLNFAFLLGGCMHSTDTDLLAALERGDNQTALAFLESNPTGLDHSSFEDKTFPNLVLKNITIRDVDWEKVTLQNAQLTNVTFDGGDFTGVDFSNSTFTGVRFLNMTMEPFGKEKWDRIATKFTGSFFNKVGVANTDLFNVQMDELQTDSQLSLLRCEITNKIKSFGYIFYHSKLTKLIIDQCDIKEVNIGFIKKADQIVIKNSHLDNVKMSGVIAKKVTLTNNTKLHMYTAGQVESVIVTGNKKMSLFTGFDTPLLEVHNNEFKKELPGSTLSIDGDVALADIKSCNGVGTINVTDTNVEKVLVNNCDMKDFRAFDSTINHLEINNSSIGRFVTFSLKGDDFIFNNVSLNQEARTRNVTIKNFDLSGLTISPDLEYEDEAYALFHNGETQQDPVETE